VVVGVIPIVAIWTDYYYYYYYYYYNNYNDSLAPVG